MNPSLKQTAPDLPAWISRELPFERYRISLGDRSMHVMETGDPRGRACVLVHGNPTWGYLYRRVALRLQTRGLRVIMPDLIGLGLSDAPDKPADHTVENHRDWLARGLDVLEVGDDSIFCVQDWGGPIGTLAGFERPGRIGGLVVLNTVLSEPREGFRPTLFHRVAHGFLGPVIFRGLRFPQAALWVAQGDRGSIRGDVARAYKYPLRTGRLLGDPAALALARMVPDSLEHPSVPVMRELKEKVRAFDGPAAIVWGKRDPVLGGALGWIKKLLPQAEVTETGAGHFLQEEVPDEIASAIRNVAAKLA
ncbi:MAG: alpha/beta fold hydrolase [Planctomycetota bacterium]|jgi:haloalkane dehalogenase